MFLVLRREVLHQLREIVDPRAQHVLFLGVPSPACRKRPFTTHADRLRPRLDAVLSNMDAELAALEARRDKTSDLKKAMMQELLIGRTRLI